MARWFQQRDRGPRDLLYLSQTKLQVLAPQLPGQVRRRLGIEAGVQAGLLSVKANLPANTQPNPVALLSATIKMIEKNWPCLDRCDPNVAPGTWITFDEEFRYGDAFPGNVDDPVRADGLVYFAGLQEPPFVLCGSAVHVLDRKQSADEEQTVGIYYVEALRQLAKDMLSWDDEGALGDIDPQIPSESALAYGVWVLMRGAMFGPEPGPMGEGWTDTVRLKGHARVLAAMGKETGSPKLVFATPLYLQYSPEIFT